MHTQQQCMCSIKDEYINLPRLVPHVLTQKEKFGTLLRLESFLGPILKSCNFVLKIRLYRFLI
jgi:hypothetical protein